MLWSARAATAQLAREVVDGKWSANEFAEEKPAAAPQPGSSAGGTRPQRARHRWPWTNQIRPRSHSKLVVVVGRVVGGEVMAVAVWVMFGMAEG